MRACTRPQRLRGAQGVVRPPRGTAGKAADPPPALRALTASYPDEPQPRASPASCPLLSGASDPAGASSRCQELRRLQAAEAAWAPRGLGLLPGPRAPTCPPTRPPSGPEPPPGDAPYSPSSVPSLPGHLPRDLPLHPPSVAGASLEGSLPSAAPRPGAGSPSPRGRSSRRGPRMGRPQWGARG